jgi:predicted transcriptional regulator
LADIKIPENVRTFIFENIDSVEQLEVLIYIRLHSGSWCKVQEIAGEMRSTSDSVELRLQSLKRAMLVEQDTVHAEQYKYVFRSEVDSVISTLIDEYNLRRHRVLQLIFSPLKKGRDFADAFRVSKPNKDSGDNNG